MKNELSKIAEVDNGCDIAPVVPGWVWGKHICARIRSANRNTDVYPKATDSGADSNFRAANTGAAAGHTHPPTFRKEKTGERSNNKPGIGQ